MTIATTLTTVTAVTAVTAISLGPGDQHERSARLGWARKKRLLILKGGSAKCLEMELL